MIQSREALETYPKLISDSSNVKWFKRVSIITGLHYQSLKKWYYTNRDFVETQRKYDENGKLISVVEKLQQKNLKDPPKGLQLSRLSTNVTTGQQWEIYTKESQNKELFNLNKDLIKKTIKELDLKPINIEKLSHLGDKILKITFTDTHVGMKIDNDIYGGGFWNENILFDTLSQMISHIDLFFDNHKKIIVQDLGDFVDGWNAETTRGGHKLPQNMSNEECFLISSKFKIELAKHLYSFGVPLEFHNIVNDNHGGSFSFIVNENVRQILSYIMPDVKYNIHEQFISHYIVDDWAFIISHGKDSKFMKFGFKPQLDDKAKNHIINYIDKHNLHAYKVCFDKGDSHIQIMDKSNPKFEYNSYMAISPSSEWVQTNFSKGRRGFSIEEIKGSLKTFTNIEL